VRCRFARLSPELGEAAQELGFNDLRMADEVDSAARPGDDTNEASGEQSVVLASFPSRRAAEHMVASLGRGFRKEHRKGHATALVISRNEDGSLNVHQSRVLSASGVGYTAMRIALSVAMGFMGTISSLRGAKGGIKEVRERGSHVGADEQQAHEILARAGPHAALALVACDNHETRQATVAKAADQATEHWDGPRPQFLADLDPGPKHDWVRTALAERT
jgi:hypothetical protein